ncbi:MAG: MerR family transcriptional regulator [Acetobacterium sp.]|nr:MerR family transcriptional regulator [Bacillota bacterium]MCG2729569.1 MerR family transcriptional regulator [Acetobacterium sp.]
MNPIESHLVQSNNYYEPRYSIKEVSALTGLSAHTIRYYDKVQLFPFLHRNNQNIRVFCDADIEWIHLIQCLRKTDLSIDTIKRYVELNQLGDDTLKERYQIICNQETELLKELEKIKFGLHCLEKKKEFFENELNRIEQQK